MNGNRFSRSNTKKQSVQISADMLDASDYKTFMRRSIREQTIKKLKLNELNKSLEDLLIDELKKPAIKEIVASIPATMKRRRSKDYRESISLFDRRNIDLATHLKHAHYPRGSYIFQARERSNKFFGVIKGIISMTKRIVNSYPLNPLIPFEDNNKINNPDNSFYSESHFISEDSTTRMNYTKPLLTPNELRSQFEIEQCRFDSGMCFGEWNLIDNTIHSSSAYCIEDTHVFYLTKEHFDAILSGPIMQASISSKAFVFKCIPMITQEDLNLLKAEDYDKGTIIYTQFTKAEEVFIVYIGECVLTHDSKAKNVDDILEKTNKRKIITIVNKGGIVGLEAANPNSFYDDNLEVSRNYTVIFRLNVKGIEKRSNIRAYLNHLKDVKGELYKLNRRVRSNKMINKQIISNYYENDHVSERLMKIMRDTRKAKDFNEFKPITTNINYSTLYSIKTEENSQHQHKLINIKQNSCISPLLIKNRPILSRNTNGNGLTEDNCSLTCGTNSKFHTFAIKNDYCNNNNINSFDNNSNNNHHQPLNIIKPLFSGTKKKPITKTINVNDIIKKTLNQITKDSKNKLVYNTGNYNLPLFTSNHTIKAKGNHSSRLLFY